MVGVFLRLRSDIAGILKLKVLSLSSQFLLAATLVLFLSMAVLGSLVSDRIERAVLETAGDEWAAFLGAFLEPHIQDLSDGEILTAAQTDALNMVFVDSSLGESLVAIKIWATDGRLIYNTSGSFVGQSFESEEVSRAAGGQTVVQLDDDSPESSPEHRLGSPLIEVYAPLHNFRSKRIIAVGELYEEADSLVDEMSASRLATWIVVFLTTVLMLTVLYLIVRRGGTIIAQQRGDLSRTVHEATLMAKQNADLRNLADRARLDASEANEQLLARVGSDLHDGPVQLLTLLMLKLSSDSSGELLEQDAKVKLTRDTLNELRTISVGLSLPELEQLTPQQNLELAVHRHESLTGTSVTLELGWLPKECRLALKICAYRVVQEALNNTQKHAPGAAKFVSGHATAETMFVSIRDNGPGLGPAERQLDERHKLGLAGMRNRVTALQGSISMVSNIQEGTQITIALPLQHDPER